MMTSYVISIWSFSPLTGDPAVFFGSLLAIFLCLPALYRAAFTPTDTLLDTGQFLPLVLTLNRLFYAIFILALSLAICYLVGDKFYTQGHSNLQAFVFSFAITLIHTKVLLTAMQCFPAIMTSFMVAFWLLALFLTNEPVFSIGQYPAWILYTLTRAEGFSVLYGITTLLALTYAALYYALTPTPTKLNIAFSLRERRRLQHWHHKNR